jgi:hypothetical protein
MKLFIIFDTGKICFSVCPWHRHKRIHRLLVGMAHVPCFWLSSYVASHHLAVAPQSSVKYQFYFTAYYTTLNWNCEAQRIKKNGKMLRLEAKINARVIWVYFSFQGKRYAKINQLIKSNESYVKIKWVPM